MTRLYQGKTNLTEVTLDVIAREITAAVKEERDRCAAIAKLYATASAVEIHRRIKTGWNPKP